VSRSLSKNDNPVRNSPYNDRYVSDAIEDHHFRQSRRGRRQ